MPMETSGMEAIISQLKAKEAGAEAAVKTAVKAGAQYVASCLQENAPVDTGALRDSIKPSSVKLTTGDGYYCEVKPVGNHPKTGEPLAKIGNILEYGRSANAKRRKAKSKQPKNAKRTFTMSARGWFHPTVEKAQSDTLNLMADTFNSEMERKK